MNDEHALVFTDVVDSTAIAERLGEQRAAELWLEHDRRARELLARHNGREIDRADGLFALFAQPVDAVGFALAYHDALAPLALRARCGVHIGAVTLRTNAPHDVARGAKPIEVDGRAKPLAARVMALAGGGQTLLTDAARQAVGAQLPAVAALRSHGHFRLKGFDAPVEVFELGHAERTAFEPPADVDKAYRVVRQGDLWIPLRAVRHNLPAERDSFVDRVHDLRALTERLAAGARLITVVGAGGTGKTRLARRSGWRQLGDWPGGVYFCDLSEARTLDGVLAAVSSALDTPLSARDPALQIGHAIAGRGRCLLILDNFEQLVAQAPDTLGRWLDRAGDAAFVVTSRERLQLRGEEVLPLEPLPPEADAIDLFADRARAHDPTFTVDAANRATIARITALVDGLPLAIELAAARVRLLAPAQLLERLHSRLQLLGGVRSAAARQATLRATIDWSWQLLNAAEQAALAQCSVFEGPFTLAAAEAVVDASACAQAPPTLDVVQALVDKSLLRRWSGGGAGRLDEPSFGMYLSIREFAAGQLDAAGAEARAAAEMRHARFYAALGTDDAIDGLYTEGGALRRLALARDLDNLVCACERALRRADADLAVQTYRAIAEVAERQGPFSLSSTWGARLLALPALAPAQRAIVEVTRAKALLRMSRLDDARAAADAAIALARALGNQRVEGRALSTLAWLEDVAGHSDTAIRHAEQALAVNRSAGHPRSIGTALSSLAYFADRQPGLDAQDLYEQALAIHRRHGNRYEECGLLWRYGVWLAERGHLARARAHFEQALPIAQQLHDRVVEGEVLTNYAVLRNELGDIDESRHLYERALAIHRDAGNRHWEAAVLGELGSLHMSAERLEDAQRCIEQALAIGREIGDRQIEGSELTNLGELLMHLGRFDEARAVLVEGETVLAAMGTRVHLGLAQCALAEAEFRCGHPTAALQACQRAEALADRLGLGPEADLRRRLAQTRQVIDSQLP